jgi:hypothetical protein
MVSGIAPAGAVQAIAETAEEAAICAQLGLKPGSLKA